MYKCTATPRHYAAWLNKWNYLAPYEDLFGGISAFTDIAFEKINGYSNEYWGWGGEDDDLSRRTFNGQTGFKMARPDKRVTKYKMIQHEHETNNAVNEDRFELLQNFQKHWNTDGLNSLDYQVLSLSREAFYTNVTVDLHYANRMSKTTLGVGKRAATDLDGKFFWTFASWLER